MFSEKTYSRQFKKDFNFPQFNKLMIQKTTAPTDELAIIFDQTFVPKSGKKTYGIERFWNGSRSCSEKGLEVSVLSVLDVKNKTAFALSATQTPTKNDIKVELKNDESTRVDWYINVLKESKDFFPGNAQYIIADALFAKNRVADEIEAMNMSLISRLRVDANLQYIYTGFQKLRGRRRKFDGKVCFSDLSRFTFVEVIDSKTKLYTAVLHSAALKCKVRLVLLVHIDLDKVRYIPLFSTDLNLNAAKIYRLYSARFQIEFLFRDAKQYTGFADCQAQNRMALNFHFNGSLSALNIAKVQDRFSKSNLESTPFSMASWKVKMHNENLLNLFFSKLDIDPTLKKYNPAYQEILNYGVIRC